VFLSLLNFLHSVNENGIDSFRIPSIFFLVLKIEPFCSKGAMYFMNIPITSSSIVFLREREGELDIKSSTNVKGKASSVITSAPHHRGVEV
jgi:hypothetical protein